MSEDRFCSCPYCEAIFRLPDTTFQHRDGIVRCGACREVFDSSMNLVIRSNGSFVPVTNVSAIVETPSNSPAKDDESTMYSEPTKDSNPFDDEFVVTRYPEEETDRSIIHGKSRQSAEHFTTHRELHTDDVKNPFEDNDISLRLDAKNEIKKSQNSRNALKTSEKIEPIFSPLNLDENDSEQINEEHSESISHKRDSRVSEYSESTPLIDDFDSELNLNLVTAGVAQGRDAKEMIDSELDSSILEESQFSGMHREGVDKYIKDRKNPLVSVMWFAVAAGFLFLLSMQVKYFFVEKYAQDENYRGYLSIFCKLAACELPAKRNPFKFTLTHTKIDLHPSQPDAVRVTVKLINEADFPQPYPDLQLTLTDRVGRVVGRRTFSPALYLKDSAQQLLGKGELASILFDLSRPHEKAVGFVIDIVHESES